MNQTEKTENNSGLISDDELIELLENQLEDDAVDDEEHESHEATEVTFSDWVQQAKVASTPYTSIKRLGMHVDSETGEEVPATTFCLQKKPVVTRWSEKYNKNTEYIWIEKGDGSPMLLASNFGFKKAFGEWVAAGHGIDELITVSSAGAGKTYKVFIKPAKVVKR